MTLRPARVLAAGALLGATLLLAACAPTVAMKAAAHANDPGCAEITVRLPDSIGGKALQHTDAQATGAWGNPAVVLLRCGVSPIGPTTKECITVNGIDWVLENDPKAKALRYITYGRTPATEIVISHGAGGVSDSTVLPDLAQAIGSIKQTHKCVAASDVPVPTTGPTGP